MVPSWYRRAGRAALIAFVWLAVAAAATTTLRAQRGGPDGGPGNTAQAAAPVDLVGTWVAVVTEDWRWRMVTPPPGDTASMPVTPAATEASANWDREADIAAGEQCKAFGAPGVMRMPTRIRISWQDAETLKLEFDNGTQTRLLHFAEDVQPPAAPDYQGLSMAHWETVLEGQGQIAGRRGRGGPGGPALSGGLSVVTTDMRPGYMRRNGVPYTADAVYTEAFDVVPGARPGNEWLIVTSQLTDPVYLAQPYMLSSHFRREADDSRFQPRPCELTEPIMPAPRTEGF
jgi:hypothetical protein